VFGVGAIEISRSAFKWLSARAQQRKESEEARKLLGMRLGDLVAYRHDSVHALYADNTELHPDNLSALTTLAGNDFMRAQDLRQITQYDVVRTSLKNNLVLIGSPTAEGLSRPVFGYEPDVDLDSLARNSPAIDLPFNWVLSKKEVDEHANIKRYVPGKGIVERPNWRIEGNKKLYIPSVDMSGLLSEDYLLVTRVRNYLSAEALDAGKYIISFGGAHGTATRAVELLLRDKASLMKVAETLGNFPAAFQMLFRVGGMKHDGRRGTRATRIELIEGPVVLPDNYDAWHRACRTASANLRVWLLSQSINDFEEGK
jgi:hypothetical protein